MLLRTCLGLAIAMGFAVDAAAEAAAAAAASSRVDVDDKVRRRAAGVVVAVTGGASGAGKRPSFSRFFKCVKAARVHVREVLSYANPPAYICHQEFIGYQQKQK